MNTVQGKNIKAQMKVDGLYYDIFCGQTCSFSLEQDELETSTKGSGTLRTYVAGTGSALFEVGGVTVSDNNENRIAITYLQQQSVRAQIQSWAVTFDDDNGDTVTYLFDGIIRSSSFDKSGVTGFSKSSVSIRVSGDFVMTTVAPPPGVSEILYSDWWVMTAGATSITGTSSVHGYTLTGKTILEVDREGIQHDLITSGTPGNRQARHSTSSILFDPTNPSLGETVFVLFKV